MGGFDHQRLDVYQSAVRFGAQAETVAGRLPREYGGLADQLRRAAASIPLNIVEGAAEIHPREKARFYRIARRSAAECSAIFDMVEAVNHGMAVPAHTRHLLYRISRVLHRLMQRHGGGSKDG